jgi:hypothetical protein
MVAKAPKVLIEFELPRALGITAKVPHHHSALRSV